MEVQSKNFIVERSIDGIKFNVMSQIAASINSSTKKSYSYIDEKPFLGKNYYRLKFYDAAGKEFIYKTLTVTVSVLSSEPKVSEQKVKISPNPVDNERFLIESLDKPITSIQLLNIIGLPIPTESIVLDNQKTEVLLPKSLPKGLYFLVLERDKAPFTEKIIIR